MTTRAQWIAEQNSRRKQRQEINVASYLRQAVVLAEHITHDQHWNEFLQLCQAKQQADEELIKAATSRLQSEEHFTPEMLAKIHHHMSLARARIQAREELIALPAWIMKNAKS